MNLTVRPRRVPRRQVPRIDEISEAEERDSPHTLRPCSENVDHQYELQWHETGIISRRAPMAKFSTIGGFSLDPDVPSNRDIQWVPTA